MQLSIIVPVLNESLRIPALRALAERLSRADGEFLVVDGGSADQSARVAADAGLTVIHSRRGRARQMNTGASAATGDVLLFLHADTVLPDDVVTLVAEALAGDACWGRFDVTITGKSPLLKVVARMMNLRSRWTGIATGDQAIFMTRAAFAAVGGYPDQPLMEDIEISKRLRRLSNPACIATHVVTSGRRWESRGVCRTIFLMWRLRWAYWRGVAAEELAKAYE